MTNNLIHNPIIAPVLRDGGERRPERTEWDARFKARPLPSDDVRLAGQAVASAAPEGTEEEMSLSIGRNPEGGGAVHGLRVHGDVWIVRIGSNGRAFSVSRIHHGEAFWCEPTDPQWQSVADAAEKLFAEKRGAEMRQIEESSVLAEVQDAVKADRAEFPGATSVSWALTRVMFLKSDHEEALLTDRETLLEIAATCVRCLEDGGAK